MEQRAAEALAKLDARLGSLREQVANLSSEQRQLVAIARALIGPAKLVVVDEPTQQLGYAYQQKLLALIRGWQVEGAAVLFSSNNLFCLLALCCFPFSLGGLEGFALQETFFRPVWCGFAAAHGPEKRG
jgi:ABC-type sugar transport system ATPase subunit